MEGSELDGPCGSSVSSNSLHFNFSTGSWAPHNESQVFYFSLYPCIQTVPQTRQDLNVGHVITTKRGGKLVHSGEVWHASQVPKRKQWHIPKLMSAVPPCDSPHKISSQGTVKRGAEKSFTLFSSRRHHLGLFMLAVPTVKIQGKCFEDVDKRLQSSQSGNFESPTSRGEL